LLIGSLNGTGLVVARTIIRIREMRTRLALGAALGRLATQVTVENLVLSMAGGVSGVGLSFLIVDSLKRIGLDHFPRSGE